MQRSCEKAVDIWNSIERKQTQYGYSLLMIEHKILVHVIKEPVLLKRNDFCTFCSTILWQMLQLLHSELLNKVFGQHLRN